MWITMKNSVDNPTNPVDNLEILAKNKPQAITAPGIIAHNRWRADTTGIVKTGEPVIFPIKGQSQSPTPQSFAAVLGILHMASTKIDGQNESFHRGMVTQFQCSKRPLIA